MMSFSALVLFAHKVGFLMDMSTSDSAFVLDLVKKQGTVTEWGAWLGLQRKTELKFYNYWIDKKLQAVKYSAWNTGEPNSPTENAGTCTGEVPMQEGGRTSHAISTPQFFSVRK